MPVAARERVEAVVDRGAHDGVEELDRVVADQQVGAQQDPRRLRRRRGLEPRERGDLAEARCRRRGSPPPRAAPSPRPAAARAAARPRGRRRRGPSSSSTCAWSACGRTPSRATVSSSASTSSGLPRVAASTAAQKLLVAVLVEAPPHERRDRLGRQRARAGSRVVAGSASSSSSSSGLAALLGRPRRHRDEQRQPVEPPREVAEPAQRRRVGPVQVVDREHRRLLEGEVGGEPVEAVHHRERRVALELGARDEVRRVEERLGERGRAGEELGALLGGQRSRAATRRAAGRRRRRSRPRARRARAVSTRSPSPACAASASSRVLPIPAVPSIATTPPSPRAGRVRERQERRELALALEQDQLGKLRPCRHRPKS